MACGAGRFVTDAAALHVLATGGRDAAATAATVARVFVAIVGDGVFGVTLIDHNGPALRRSSAAGQLRSPRQPCRAPPPSHRLPHRRRLLTALTASL